MHTKVSTNVGKVCDQLNGEEGYYHAQLRGSHDPIIQDETNYMYVMAGLEPSDKSQRKLRSNVERQAVRRRNDFFMLQGARVARDILTKVLYNLDADFGEMKEIVEACANDREILMKEKRRILDEAVDHYVKLKSIRRSLHAAIINVITNAIQIVKQEEDDCDWHDKARPEHL